MSYNSNGNSSYNPFGLTPCAGQNDMCSWQTSIPQNVAYVDTVNDLANFRDVSGNSIMCNDATFGDPSPTYSKYCYRRDVPTYIIDNYGNPQGWTKCSDQNQTCRTHYDANVLYGANGSFVSGITTGSKPLSCNDATFPSSITGTNKACYVTPVRMPASTPASTPVNTPAYPPAYPPLNNATTLSTLATLEEQAAANARATLATYEAQAAQKARSTLAALRAQAEQAILEAQEARAEQAALAALQEVIEEEKVALAALGARVITQPIQPAANGIAPASMLSVNIRNQYGAKSGTFFGWDDIEIPGFDMEGMPLTSRTENICAIKCLDTPNCYFYSYDQPQQQCWLKELQPNNRGINGKFLMGP